MVGEVKASEPVRQARSHCPINGTRPFDLVKCRDRRERDHEKKRKAQAEVRRASASIEHQAARLGVQGTGGIEKVSYI